MRIASFLLVLAALSGLLQVSPPNQTYTTYTTTFAIYTNAESIVSIGQTTFRTTSTYSVEAGTIPASFISDSTDLQVCYYVSYPIHVDNSIQRIVGTISGSRPLNFYIMLQAQYNDFVSENLPCGSPTAIKVDYSRNELSINWTPNPGDYYILLQNVSTYAITYTIQIFAIGNVSSTVYSTMQLIQLATLTQISAIGGKPFMAITSNGKSPVYDDLLPIGIVVIVIAVLVLLSRSRRRRAKEDNTRVR